MAVRIDSGPVDEFDDPLKTPQDKWLRLMWLKRDFISTSIQFDCRCLLKFVTEAEDMWEVLGFDSVQDMIRNGYKLDPVEVDYALSWLRLRKPEDAAPYIDAIKAGRKLASHGGDRRSQDAKTVQGSDVTTLKGRGRDYLLARLERDRPEVLAELRAGKHKSVHAAALAAGLIKAPVKLSAIDKARRALSALSEDDRHRLFVEFEAGR